MNSISDIISAIFMDGDKDKFCHRQLRYTLNNLLLIIY